MGIKRKKYLYSEIGSVIELNRQRFGVQKDTVQSGSVLIDGLGIRAVGNVVLREEAAFFRWFVHHRSDDFERNRRASGRSDIVSRGLSI